MSGVKDWAILLSGIVVETCINSLVVPLAWSTCKKPWLKEIELAWSHGNLGWKIEGVDLSDLVYQNLRCCAANDRSIVNTLPQVDDQRLCTAVSGVNRLQLNETNNRNEWRK